MADIDTKSMSLLQKLAGVREIADILEKDKKGYGYTYTSEEEILLKVRAGLSKYNVTIYPSFVHESIKLEPRRFTKQKYNRDTKSYEPGDEQVEHTISAWLNFHIINNDDPDDAITVPWYMTASTGDPSQAMGSALTYANRYFLLKFFNIATSEDDPDEWRKRNQDAMHADEIAAASKVVDQIAGVVKQHLKQEDRAKFADMLKKYIIVNGAPSADYMTIKSLDKANEVYAAVRKFFGLNAGDKEE